jgi:hypothetical protein
VTLVALVTRSGDGKVEPKLVEVSWGPYDIWMVDSRMLRLSVQNESQRNATAWLHAEGQFVVLRKSPNPTDQAFTMPLLPPNSQTDLYMLVGPKFEYGELWIVPWTPEEAEAAEVRYARWPPFVRNFMVRRYREPDARYRHRIKAPPRLEPSGR